MMDWDMLRKAYDELRKKYDEEMSDASESMRDMSLSLDDFNKCATNFRVAFAKTQALDDLHKILCRLSSEEMKNDPIKDYKLDITQVD
jgi:hypothetical protein